MTKWLNDVVKHWKQIEAKEVKRGKKTIQNEQDSAITGLRCKIIEFIADNPNPGDDQMHKFADTQGINPHKLEEVIYSMISEIIEKGKGIDPDPNELAMGIKVEFEHTSCPKLAEFIAKTHLKELPDYYSKLKKMEGK